MSDDKKNNYSEEEYHFAVEPDVADIDLNETSIPNEPENSIEKNDIKQIFVKFKPNMETVKKFFEENTPARNAVVAIGTIIILVLIYMVISSIFESDKSNIAKQKVTQIPQNKIQTNYPAIQETKVVKDYALEKKLTIVEQNQNNLQSRFEEIKAQSLSVNNNLTQLMEKINELSQKVTSLATTVDEQSQAIISMKQRSVSEHKIKVVKKPIYKPQQYLEYNVQAVIPGRAWLIANNGSTKTVRKGSMLPGYGIVTIIDAIQGRVMTSSGKMIKFSQEDS
jgi:intracellular multiplication protein IcmG